MDADSQERRREYSLSQREKRWSMNSQRLEEIVAELMKPISDIRRSFDTDLSALLEEYLTEAGLHALEAEEAEEEAALPAVNFAELALVLQHSASVYGRKVDLLYQHVLDCSDSLLNCTQEVSGNPNEEPATPSGRRKRRASVSAGFEPLELAASPAARREPGAPRPPPTLPRIYIELEPRAMADCDAPLTDYDAEPIGLLTDFHVTWRLQDGVLVDELEGSGRSGAAALRPIPLLELSAALAAAAPPDPPPRCSTPLQDHAPLDVPLDAPLDSTLDAPLDAPLDATPETPLNDTLDSAIEMTPLAKVERKRKGEPNLEDVGRIKILISQALREELSTVREFCVASEWVSSVVSARKRRILGMRHEHRKARPGEDEVTEFHGFDCSAAADVGGFLGWSESECAVAASQARGPRLEPDSDDDGFFEQSSLGDSDASRHDDASQHHLPLQAESESAVCAEWQRAVLQRAQQHEARALDVRALADRLLQALPHSGEPELFSKVLCTAKAEQYDVSGLFLSTLFLANSGNVEVIPGAPLELNSFSVRLVSRDQQRLSAAAAAAAADGIARPPRS